MRRLGGGVRFAVGAAAVFCLGVSTRADAAFAQYPPTMCAVFGTQGGALTNSAQLQYQGATSGTFYCPVPNTSAIPAGSSTATYAHVYMFTNNTCRAPASGTANTCRTYAAGNGGKCSGNSLNIVAIGNTTVTWQAKDEWSTELNFDSNYISVTLNGVCDSNYNTIFGYSFTR
jgi:hypothetical protein